MIEQIKMQFIFFLIFRIFSSFFAGKFYKIKFNEEIYDVKKTAKIPKNRGNSFFADLF